MGILNKLFGKNENVASSSNNESATGVKLPIIKRSIYDFFTLDLRAMPDESFVEGETVTNSEGEQVQNYRKTLDYKECNIFDTVEIKVVAGKTKNVFFKSFQPEKVNMVDMKKLIDELYLIYGDDSQDKGKFTNKDINDYNDTQFYMLFGRSWYEFPKYKYPVSVGRDDDEVSISMWGV